MSLETEALQRCERLLLLMSEAMRMERELDRRVADADARTVSLIKPILDDALVRLEPLMSRHRDRSLGDCVRELTDLELELDAAIAKRGWRVIELERHGPRRPSTTQPEDPAIE